MNIINVCLTALGSVVTLFFLAKLMGYRQMSQLSMFDYINGISIGSIAAEMASSGNQSWFKPFIAMVLYALAAICLSFLEDKSIVVRRFVNGNPLLLYQNGEIYFRNLKKARMDLGEFLTQCRVSGYFDLQNVHTILLESNGHLSILPMSEMRPPSAKELSLIVPQEQLLANVIIDGKVMQSNLQATGNNEHWLVKQLKNQGFSDASSVFLATCDANNTLVVYKRSLKKVERTFLE